MARNTETTSPTHTEVTKVYTGDEVAAIFQVNERTIRRLTYTGLLPCRRIGRCVRYTAEDIQAYLDRCADSGAA